MEKCEICLEEILPGEGVMTSLGTIHKGPCPDGAERSGVLQGCLPSANCSAGARADARNDSLNSSVVPRETAVFPALPNGITRAEAVEGLRELRNDAVAAEKAKDPCFNRWPDLDAILDYIEQYGFPAPEKRSPLQG